MDEAVRYCLERTLRIDPNNARAHRGIEWLNARQAEIDEARAAAERVKPYWQTTKPKPLLNLVKGATTTAQTASGETAQPPVASWTSVSLAIPGTRTARSNAPTTPVSPETLNRITGEHKAPATGSYTEEVLAPDDLSPRFVTNMALHNLLGALKKITGEPGYSAMLTMAHMEEFESLIPAANEDPGANFTTFSALGEAMEEFFGHESCGKCTPCREGTSWLFKVLSRIEAGRGVPGDLDKGLTFSLERVTGMKTPDDWHNTGVTFTLDDKDHMTQRWTYLYKGKTGSTVFHYTRKK